MDVEGMEKQSANEATDQTREHRADPAAGQLARYHRVRGPTHESSDEKRYQQLEEQSNRGQHQPAEDQNKDEQYD
jgi:hypothetical protein